MFRGLIDFAFGLLRNKKFIIIVIVSLLVLLIGTGSTLYILKYMDTRYDYDEDDAYLELPNYTYTLGEYYDRLSYQYGVDIIENLIDDEIILNVSTDPHYDPYNDSYYYILNKYLYGLDIEEDDDVEYDELYEAKKEYYQSRGIYDEYIIRDFEDRFYRRFVYAKQVYEETIKDRRLSDGIEFFTPEMYKELFIEQEGLYKYAFVISFNSLNELNTLLDGIGVSLNYQNKFVAKDDSSLLSQGQVAEIFMSMIELKYFNNHDIEYFEQYNTYTRSDNGYDSYNIKFDMDRLNNMDNIFDNVKFVFSNEELEEMPTILRNSINNLSVYSEYSSVTKSYELCQSEDNIYLVYKIEDETVYADDYINHKDTLFYQLLEESFNVDIMNAVLYNDRAKCHLKICNEELHRQYNNKYESYKDIINNLFGGFIPLDEPERMRFNYIIKFTRWGQEYSIHLSDYHQRLSFYFGNGVGLEFLEEYMLFNSGNNDIYNPYTKNVINGEYYQYYLNGESYYGKDKTNPLNTIKGVKDAFYDNYYEKQGYSNNYGWDNFLKDYFYVETEDELFIKLAKNYLLEKTYVDYYDEFDINHCVENLYEDFFALKIINLQVYVDNDNNGKMDYHSLDYYMSDSWTEVQKIQAESLLNRVMDRQQELSGNVYERINNAIEEYKNASYQDPYWGEFVLSNLQVTVESPCTYTDSSNIVDEFKKALYDIYQELKHSINYTFDLQEDFVEPYYNNNATIETNYGYHKIITLNGYTPYYIEKEDDLTISLFDLSYYKDYLAWKNYDSLKLHTLTEEHYEGLNYYTKRAIDRLYTDEHKKMIYSAIMDQFYDAVDVYGHMNIDFSDNFYNYVKYDLRK